MYVYFDKNGTIKEVINDLSIRKGSAEANKIYVYVDDTEIDDIWFVAKKPDGTLTTEQSFINNVVNKAVPYDAKRDLYYFKDFEIYKFYVFTLTANCLDQSGLIVATIRISKDNSIFALGELTFNVQENVVKDDNGITQSQYDYLLLAYASRTLSEQTGSDLDTLLDDKIEAEVATQLEPIDEALNDKIDAQNATIASLSQASPSVFDTTAHIQLLQENKGVAVATDTGYIWYWDTTVTPNAYSNSNIQYNSLANYVKHSGNQLQDTNGNDFYPMLGESIYDNLLSALYATLERKRYNNYDFVGVTYAVSLTTPIIFTYDVVLKCNSGFKFKIHYWKTNATGQSNYIMQSADWYTVIYIPKNTYFTFEIRKSDGSTITLNEALNVTLKVKVDYTSVSFINTYIKNIMKPVYWDATNKTFPASATRVSATEILFANDDIPIYVHDNSKVAFNIYYVEKDGTAINTTGFMNTDYVIPKGNYFVISLRNYSNNVITNVNELISYISFGKSEYFEKLFGAEIFIPNNININNEETKIKLENTHYLRGNSEKRFSLLHFSDIHGDSEILRRAIKYRDYVTSLLDDTICTGDLVNGRFSDDFNYWLNISEAKNILLAVGNHDSFTTNSYDDNDLASMSDVSTKFFTPLISNWDVTDYTSETTYYYKDYASKSIRLIVLDSQRIGADATTQLTWLESALADAITKNLAVIIAMHYFPSQNVTQYDCSFSMYQYRTYNLSSEYVGFDVVGAVDTFINNGGEFITYLVGHKHADGFGYVENHNNQTVCIITCANPSKVGTGSDQSRNRDNKSCDALNLLTVDTGRKYIQLIRVGATNTMFNLDRVSLCFDYSNKTFIKK